jgi:hypothetical protein
MPWSVATISWFIRRMRRTARRAGSVSASPTWHNWWQPPGTTLRCELVLLHSGQPSATAKWLADKPVTVHHQLRRDCPQDVARLARMVTGFSCG